MYDQSIKKLQKIIHSSPKKIVITIHHRPDGDAIGSALALYQILKKNQHTVTIISTSPFPKFLAWMPAIENIVCINEYDKEKNLQQIAVADYIFCLDYSSLCRINYLGDMVKSTNACKIVVDHHLDPESFADIYIWNPQASSTAEIVYDVIKKTENTSLLDKDIASCLYAGILTDTGSFKYSNTSTNTHFTVAELIQYNIDVTQISQNIYDNNSLNKLMFISYAIKNRLHMLTAYKTAYFKITKQDMQKFHLKTGDTEGLVNYALSLEDITMAALIKDRDKYVSLSFRSYGNIPVNELASKYFDGGGHKNAAAGKSSLSLDKTVDKFIEIIHNKNLHTT